MKKSAYSQTLIALTALIIFAVPAFSASIVQESVKDVLAHHSASSSVELLISFDNDLDRTAIEFDRLRDKLNRAASYHDVMNRLIRNREALENSLGPQLEAMKAAGSIESYKFFTVSKTVLVRTRVDNIEKLSQLPGVRLINLNQNISLIDPVEEQDAQVFAKTALANSALESINIRSLWNRGLTGRGRLICSFDTGVDGDHPALESKWRGNNGVASDAAWFAPYGGDIPHDNIGHGSHVMGIMVGSTATDTIGVAPDAQWISAAVIDQGVSFSSTIADILSAFDWALNPDGDINTTDDIPDVVCNSWGIPKGVFNDCDNTFWTAIDNLEAAGIVAVFAAGNEGPTPASLRNPADRASTPLNSFSVGAVDPQTKIVADFSSRGPASCDGVSIKPEVTAPGVGIYSSYKDGGYKIMSGTSMSTPFVAGLVVLMRQYNPEATVAEIKNALIQATTDLGPTGEDNNYGYGFIDASRVLDFMPAPDMPQISVYNSHLFSGGDNYADPGEAAEMTMTLNEPTAIVDSVDVWITSNSPSVTSLANVVRFRFAQGSAYAVSLDPFYLNISFAAISGSTADLMVHFGYMNGLGQDSTAYSIQIGHILPGRIFAVNSGELSLTASDFGQLGFGPGSIYQAGGDGLRFQDSPNLLYEAGLIVAGSTIMVSDAIRDSQGRFKVSAFVPSNDNLSVAANFDETLAAGYSDDKAALPLPIDVEQDVYQSAENFMILQFSVVNPTASKIEHLGLGFFCDLDLDRFNDRIGFDSLMGMMYQYDAANGRYIGLMGVSPNEFAYTAAQNGTEFKRGFTTSDKFALADATGLNFAAADAGDWYCTVSRRTDQIEAFGKRKMAIALAAGTTLSDLRTSMQSALNEYSLYLDVDDQQAALPTTMELDQNYPNPFNPQTTISFALNSAQMARLDVYNVTGQKVRTLLDGQVQAGRHDIVWDGHDDTGRVVASGIYFYRLTTVEESQSRKMVFLK